LNTNKNMRNQYKILAEKYSLVKEDGKEDIMAGLHYLTNDVITDAGQYGDSGMERVLNLLLKKYNGKVSKKYLDWIKDNFNEYFVGIEYPEESLDYWFEVVVNMKMDDGTEKISREYIENDILNDLEEYYQKYKIKNGL